MKKLFTLTLAISFFINSYGQRCAGLSGCTPPAATGALALFSPPSSSIPCFTQGVYGETIINIEKIDSFVVQALGSSAYYLLSINIDSIGNLPAGLCWQPNISPPFFDTTTKTGCMKISGTTTATPGQYRIRVIVTAVTNIGTFPSQDLASPGILYYYIRVKANGGLCENVDTLNGKTNEFIPYINLNCPTPPTLSLSIDTLSNYCANIIATSNATSFKWNTGFVSNTFQSCTSGTYSVTVVDNNFCGRKDSISWQSAGVCKDTICGYLFRDENSNGIWDATEPPIRGWNIKNLDGTLNDTIVSDAQGYYQFVINCGTNPIFGPYEADSIYYTITSPTALYNTNMTSPGKYCGFNFGIKNNGARINGYTYLDLNSNFVFDPTDSPLANQGVNIGSQIVFSKTDGSYTTNVAVGTYTVSTIPNVYYPTSAISPSSITVVTQAGNTYSQKNFGFSIPSGINLAIGQGYGIPFLPTPPRPGFGAKYNLKVMNVGTAPIQSIFTFEYDSSLQFQNSTPSPSSVDSTSRILTYNLASLAPQRNTSFNINFGTSTTLALGTPITNIARVIPTSGTDVDTLNNVYTINQVVVGSYDPNDKVVAAKFANPRLNLEDVLPNTSIDYTINFQNTGTFYATNVVVADTLDTNFDLTSFRLLETSHPCQVERNGRNVLFKFEGIMLLDSFTNEPKSHGFVRYRITPKTATIGTMMKNTAYIYFDFNEAIVTNTTTNIINNTIIGIKELSGDNIFVYPNPTNHLLTIDASNQKGESVELTLTDVLGATMQRLHTALPHTLDCTTLSTGTYFLQLKNKEGAVVKKVMVN